MNLWNREFLRMMLRKREKKMELEYSFLLYLHIVVTITIERKGLTDVLAGSKKKIHARLHGQRGNRTKNETI